MIGQAEKSIDQYREAVSYKFEHFFSAHKIKDISFHCGLAAAIVACFHLKNFKIKKLDKALIILNSLFYSFSKRCTPARPFQFSEFIAKHLSKKKEVEGLIIELLYGLYFKDIDLSNLIFEKQKNDFEFLLFQKIAEKVSEATLRKIIQTLSLDMQVRLICFSFQHYREGSYLIIREFEQLFKRGKGQIKSSLPAKNLVELINLLKRRYYDADHLFILLQKKEKLEEADLTSLMHRLEEHAWRQTQEFHSLLDKLIPLIINFPIKVHDAIEKLKQTTYSASQKSENTAKLQAQKESLEAYFKDYYKRDYSVEDFNNLLKVIGFRGHYPYIRIYGKDIFTTSLIDKLNILNEIFSSPPSLAQINQSELLSIFSFILMLVNHLEAVNYNPSKYKEGIELLTCAIPTCGKRLSRQSGLNTLLEGLISFTTFLNEKLRGSITLSKLPIFVFDQSNESLFNENCRYIRNLNKYHGSNVVHVSKNDALALANKIGLEPLLNTTQHGSFGFGGSRNCVFLLTALLKKLYAGGKRTFRDILQEDKATLISIFQQTVLEKQKDQAFSENMIFMIDDDMEIPQANFFPHALFVQQCSNAYAFSHGFCYGRATKFQNRFRNLNDLLEKSLDTFDFTQWLRIPFSITMAEFVGNPKICLNLPLGQEESHLRISKVPNPLLHISYHLGGTRYPGQQIPTHFFVGLEKHLERFIPYTMDINISSDLIDPSNELGQSILPWNDIKIADTFTCLQDVFIYIANDNTRREMQHRFWKNVQAVFDKEQGNNIPLRICLNDLMTMDIDLILKEFKKQNSLDRTESAALSKIGELYKFFQRDAKIFWEFGSMLLTHEIDEGNSKKIIEQTKQHVEKQQGVSFADYTFTQSFYLLCHSAGAGGFSDIIRGLL